jgi:hypothetical protein
MILIAHRQLTGVYGTVSDGEQFECPDAIAENLIERNLAHKAEPPQILYETKVIERAPEVSPVTPFCDLPVRHEEPTELAAESNRVLPEPDVSAPRVTDRGRRRDRKRSASTG